ncbi:glutathione peroxidase [Rhizorhabdus wittichii]|jgi:glutathione peroxidase|uniref:Glutathione peroxidase n=2 Tax=Rhizorhabdus wittichii TaxID=160791 RepID=A0A9J9LD88_RHIWR|nr:glutathione peroxidase [Rhizorhabdus wittichii]ABQ67565.1 glutathione peroxidase [Rhizorhabdus wittichii RW1]QTH22043.1 glutathione peroxidase [Rhizorhabdus wittichii]
MATDIQQIPLKTIGGADATLGDYAGKVLLAVNVASKCGLTPQYTALEALYGQYKDKGFAVLGFPANNFGAQEPGTESEIQEFCTTNYGVDFPMFAKLSVKGDDQHPLYAKLVAAQPDKTFKDGSFKEKLAGYGIVPEKDTDVLWNFEKFLIAKDGTVAGRFAPDIAPDDPIITGAIEAELAK